MEGRQRDSKSKGGAWCPTAWSCLEVLRAEGKSRALRDEPGPEVGRSLPVVIVWMDVDAKPPKGLHSFGHSMVLLGIND